MSKLLVIEREGQRVLTTQQLADAYGTDDKKIRDNFTNNKHRYTEGKHFFKVEGEELKTLKDDTENFGAVGTRASSVYLWTEKGAWLHAKSLNTDKAWEAYEMLVDEYYRIKATPSAQLSPELQMFNLIFQSVAKMELQQQEISQELVATTETLQNIKETVVATTDNWREDINKMFNKIVTTVGGEKFQELRRESYSLLERRSRVNLNVRLDNLKARLLKQGASKTVINKTNKLDVIEIDPKLREIYLAIIKEYSIKFVS